MSGKTSFAQSQLQALVERIERLEDEKAAIAADIKEVYAEAKANGFDTKILRKVISLRKKDANERAEEEAMLDVYLAGLGMQASLFDEPSSATAVEKTATAESGSGTNAATGAPAAPIGSSGTGHPFAGAGKPLTDETSDAGPVSVGLSTAKSDDLAEIQPRPVPESAAVQVEGVFPVSAPSTDITDMEIPAFLVRRTNAEARQ